jgi:site-specific DNA-methyltransferase (cytosine-N4-specific)
VNDRAAYANADARLLPLPDKSVHMIATSPPYWGLRSYATGDNKHAELGAEPLHDCLAWARGEEPCGACYVCNMRTWAREMHRVLRDDGCMFLNLADSYASSGRAGPVSDKATWHGGGDYDAFPLGRAPTPPGLKPKDLCGIPQRVVWRCKPTAGIGAVR